MARFQTVNPFSDPSRLNILFSHVAYQFEPRLKLRPVAFRHQHVSNLDQTKARLADVEVLVISALWNNALLEAAPKLRFIQSIGAGYNQFPLEELKRRGIRLASARGVNSNAVSEHAMAMVLAFTRQIAESRDHQSKHNWRGLVSDPAAREDELGGKTMLIFGLGTIGSRLAGLARAFGLRVIGIRRNVGAVAKGVADEVHPPEQLEKLIPQADFVALTCPLTPETTDLINARTLALMKPSAYLINVARGGCVDETALLHALGAGRIAGAGLDAFKTEPLPSDSPFWDFANVIITPHTAGETRKYEDNVLDILFENLDRLAKGKAELVNQIV
jgi:phosphoglycerate dehydrogenase-like enzyme